MIVQLSGTLVELTSSHVIIDVAGVGYEWAFRQAAQHTCQPKKEVRLCCSRV